MFNEEKVILEPGWGYFQIQRVDNTRKDGTPYISKKGSPMINLHLSITDSTGKTARVFDWITPEMNWKIFNLEEVLEIKGLYDFQKGGFNKDLLLGKAGACSLETQHHETYGEKTQVKMYVPLTFLEFVTKMEKSEVEMNEKKKAPKSPLQKDVPKMDSFLPASLDDDDEIPF
jgi:hypothetical protein